MNITDKGRYSAYLKIPYGVSFMIRLPAQLKDRFGHGVKYRVAVIGELVRISSGAKSYKAFRREPEYMSAHFFTKPLSILKQQQNQIKAQLFEF